MNIKPYLPTISLLLAASLNIGTASASIIDSSSTTLDNAEVSLGFNELVLSNGETITNQYSSFGVSFSPQLSFLNTVSSRPNFSGAALVNFGFSGGKFTTFDPFSLLFTNTISEAAFAFTTNGGSTTFEALLNNSVVESFTSNTNLSAQNFYGFENIAFNEIRVISNSFPRTAALDNLSFSTAAVVAEPTIITLFATGMLLMGGLRHKRTS